MPYVPQESSPAPDVAVDQLVTAISAEAEKLYEGLLNYAITRVVVGTMQEFYRRFAAKNGDLAEYEQEAPF